jgi:hypothetical protein
MKTHNFTTTLLVDQSPKEVFNAVNKPQNWWSGEIEGSSAQLNDEFSYRYKDIHFSKQRVVEMIPNQKVVWLVTDSSLNYTEDVNEWTGTKISFEITEKDGKTELRFSHIGLVPEIECFDSCSGAWTQLVRQSLASLITSGQGRKLVLDE